MSKKKRKLKAAEECAHVETAAPTNRKARRKSRSKYATDAERLAAQRSKGYENARKRWPEGMVTKEPPRIIADGVEEDLWLSEAETHINGFAKMSRNEQRRAAKRLADAHMIRETVAVETGSESPTGVDEETREVYWRRERELWAERVERDERVTARHRAYIDNADRELGAILMRRVTAR